MKISVLTPTNRHKEGLIPVMKALRRQTFDKGDFEWIVGSPDPTVTELVDNFVFVQDPPKKEGDVWALNKAYNEMIRRSKGDLIISVQDFTFFDATALEKFWYHYETEPKTLVTGVGDKYESINPLEKCVWNDPRINSTYGTYYPCYFNDVEFNFCAVPKSAFYSVGGWDEELDRYFGMDGYSVVDRLNIQGGWDFKINQTIKSYSLPHGRYDSWEELNAIHGPYMKRRDSYTKNPILPYLS